jgi:hypothetical protein
VKNVLCDTNDNQFDDVFVGKIYIFFQKEYFKMYFIDLGRCLKGLALFIDGHDKIGQKRFFPVKTDIHFEPALNPNDWYAKYLWNNVTQGGLDCCSDTFIDMHYVTPSQMDELEFLIYQVHPFGLEKNLTETLPRKFFLQEIIASSDQRSFAQNYRNHKTIHQIDDDEKY